jgi:chromosome segregation ATPase
MSEVINKNKYLDFGGLQKYDALIKGLIASGNKELADAIAALDAKIGSLNVDGSDDKSLTEIVEDIYASIADIVESQIALEDKDAELAAQIKKVADDLEFVTGSSSDNEATLGEINAKLADVQDDLDSLAKSMNKVSEDVAAAAQAAADAQIAADAAQATADTAAAAIDILAGEGEGSVKKIAEDAAADAVAAVVAGAESDFDTLKEVAEWIAADKEGSAALQVTVSGHTESINAINGDLDALEAKVDEDIANLSTHISDASVALSEVDGRLDTLEAKVDEDIANLTAHMTEAAAALSEVDGRLDALESFEETHASIDVSDIEGLFA